MTTHPPDAGITSDPANLLAEQQDYYRARAAEYDEWWYRQGRYDRGPEQRQRWQAEIELVETALAEFHPTGHVLELAGGTGIWSQHLAKLASTLTVVDAAPEMLAINRERTARICAERGVYYRQIQADIFDWHPEQPFDVVFFGFWLSHVPAEKFDAFWRQVVAPALTPLGRVFFVDSKLEPASQAVDHAAPDAAHGVAERRLNDGRTFRIVKRFYEPAALKADLARLGFHAEVSTTPEFFLVGNANMHPSLD